VRRIRLETIQGLLAVASAADLEALGLQDLREGLQDVRVVIDDEDDGRTRVL
jgi:hypothetical protein